MSEPSHPPISETEPVSPFERDMLSTAKGGSVLMVGRLFTYASRIVMTILLARILDAEQYGLYNLAITAATITAGIAMFGLDTTVMRYIAITNSRGDKPGIWGAIQVSVGTALLLSILGSTALFALAYPIAEHFFNEPRLVPLLQVASFVVPFLTMSDVLSGATRGFKNMRDTVVAQNFVQPAIRLVLIGVLAVSGLNVTQAILIFGFADACASVVLVYFLNKHFSLRRSMLSARREPRAILGFSLPLWLSDIMTTFRGNLQTLMLGSLDTVRGVGIFAVASQVNLIGNIFHASLNQSARPLIAELHDRGQRNQLQHLYQTTTKWVFTLNLPMILVMVLFPAQLMSIFGRSFVEGSTVLAIMAVVNLVNVSTGMCGAIIEMTGYSKLKLFNSAVRISLAIYLNFLLIPRWGVVGAAMAALIHEVVANLLPLVQVWFLFRLVPYNRSMFKPILAGAASLGAALILREWLPPTANVLDVGFHILVILSVYGGAILLLGLSNEERFMLTRLRRRAVLLFSRQ